MHVTADCFFNENNLVKKKFIVLFDIKYFMFLCSSFLSYCSKIKMVNELLEGIHFVTSMEAISLGTKAGIHPWMIYDIISNAAGNSWLVVLL